MLAIPFSAALQQRAWLDALYANFMCSPSLTVCPDHHAFVCVQMLIKPQGTVLNWRTEVTGATEATMQVICYNQFCLYTHPAHIKHMCVCCVAA